MTRADRILISAFVGSDNLGDEAVFLSLAELLAGRLRSGKLTVASTNPKKTRKLLRTRNCEGLARLRVTRRGWLPAAIATHNTCVFGGGGIIQDQSSIFNLAYFLLQIQLARLLRKKVLLAFVGIGPVRSRLGRAWTRATLSGVSACIVRDDESRALLQELGVARTPIYSGADIALNLACEAVRPGALPGKCPYMLISLRHWYGQQRILTPAFVKSGRVRKGSRLDILLNGLVRELSAVLERDRELRIVAVPLFGARDQLVHKELCARFEPRYRARLTLAGSVTDPCEYLNLARSAVCVVAMRLHALILASLCTVPLVALSYSPKVSAFMRQLELGRNVLDVEWEPDVTDLADCIAAASTGSGRMRQRVETLQQSNMDAMDRICRIIGGE